MRTLFDFIAHLKFQVGKLLVTRNLTQNTTPSLQDTREGLGTTLGMMMAATVMPRSWVHNEIHTTEKPCEAKLVAKST